MERARVLTNPPSLSHLHRFGAIMPLDGVRNSWGIACVRRSDQDSEMRNGSMDIDKVINDRVMLVLREVDGLRAAGVSEHNFYAKVVGRDHIGLWIENPKFEITRVRREDGTIIPPDERVKEEYIANILIPWGNVRSIVHFPQRSGYDYEEITKPLGGGVYL
jgi:hypothetical protein